MHRFALLALLVISPLNAAMADLSWYVGAGGSYTTLETTNFATSAGIAAGLPSSESVVTGEFKDSPTGWQLFGGLMFTENFGVALKYSDFGTAKDQWGGLLVSTISPGPPPSTTETDLGFNGEMSIDGVSLYFIQTVPVTEKIEFSLELGFTRQDVDFKWSETSGTGAVPAAGSISRDDTGFALGGLFRYKFIRNFAVSAEIEYSTPDFGGLIDRPLRFSLNGELHF